MFRCSDVQIFRCSDVQIFSFSDVQMGKCSNVQMSKCSNAQMLKCSNVKISKCSNFSMFQCSNDQIFQSLESSESNVQIFWQSGIIIDTVFLKLAKQKWPQNIAPGIKFLRLFGHPWREGTLMPSPYKTLQTWGLPLPKKSIFHLKKKHCFLANFLVFSPPTY